MSADRDLLLGLIALQNNFVDRHQLVSAFDRWAGDKSLSLAALLVQAKAISDQERLLIEALVDRQLAKHGGDAQASLAAFHPSVPIAEDLRKLPDRDLQASIGHLLGRQEPTSQTEPDLMDTLLRGGSGMDQGLSRFRVLRAHAQGGLGEVFVAQDDELHRVVALKRMREMFADDPLNRSRFIAEAEITGALEHPGIVPVYGQGRYPDGRPYYAMRFVRGDRFKEAIDRYHQARDQHTEGDASLSLRALLGRFIDVCDAMEYAHSRGILHRDLKPGNIMLGPFGETLVVDWGLARTLDDPLPESERSSDGLVRPFSGTGNQQTIWGSAVGTPQFMSPEQASGQLELLGPASDVYSLGATLYYLLTGKPPVTGDSIGEILQKVQRGEIVAPREHNPQTDPGLAAICLKAMAVDRKQRYRRASELAADIQCWLGDEPVSAFPESWRHRLGRWTRRNHAVVMVGSAATVVALTVLSISLWLISAAHQRETQAHERAEQSFRAARDTVDEYFTQVSETRLLNQPGLQPVRRDLLTSALKYYQDFLSQRGHDSMLKADAAAAAFNLGRIHEELGDLDRASPFYEQAKVMQHELLNDAPDDLLQKEKLSDTLTAQGRVALNSGAIEASFLWNDEALGLRQSLVESQPRNMAFHRKLASNFMNQGLLLLRSGAPVEAERALRRAQEIRLPWVKTEGAESLRRDLAKGHYNLGLLAVDRQDAELAHHEFDTATRQAESLLEVSPHDLELKLMLSTCYRLTGDSIAGGENPKLAVSYYENALNHLQSLTNRNPEIAEYQIGLAELYMNLANVYQQDDQALAQHSLSEAINIFRALETRNVGPTVRRDLAVALRTRASLSELATDSRSLTDLEQAVKILESLVAEHAEQVEYANELALTRSELETRRNDL